MNLNRLRRWTQQGTIWPDIDYELNTPELRALLSGNVLNAGAGSRDISHLVDGELVNQDIPWPGDERTHIDIFSPIHDIPRPDGTFDTIVCIAVLEHVENPEEVIPEFFRVLKPGGQVIASVPFLQPEHKIPTDYQRYTRDGLQRLFEHHGFRVNAVKPLFTVYHTLHWIVYEWLNVKPTFGSKFLKLLILPILATMAKISRLQSDKIASAFQVIAQKPGNKS